MAIDQQSWKWSGVAADPEPRVEIDLLTPVCQLGPPIYQKTAKGHGRGNGHHSVGVDANRLEGFIQKARKAADCVEATITI
jgi:hypothetical protein